MPGLVGRLRGRSLRARLVLLGTAGLAVGLAVGGLVLVTVLRVTLERTVDAAARQTATDVAALVDADRLPDPVPVGGTTVVQVVDADNRVRAASIGTDRLVPVLTATELTDYRDGDGGYLSGARFGVSGVVRVVALPAGPPGDPQTVVVAAPAADISRSVAIVRTALIVGYAVVLAVLAALAWRIVGATLRPVEALRAGAEDITGSGSTELLPLPSARDEIHRLAETLNGMLERLAAARRRQRAFVADAAHELRSPLTSLRTQLEVAAATDTPAEVPDLLAEVDRLIRLVADLLLLARADDAGPRAPERVDLADLVRATVTRFVPSRVPIAVAAVPTPALVDPDAVTRIVANLVDNAVRYAASCVDVTVGPGKGGCAVLAVVDDGPGIPAAERERVLGRFARLGDARDRDSGGTGLGLAIVAELVRQHGGSLRLSEPDTPDGAGVRAGLRVEVRLPPAQSS